MTTPTPMSDRAKADLIVALLERDVPFRSACSLALGAETNPRAREAVSRILASPRLFDMGGRDHAPPLQS